MASATQRTRKAAARRERNRLKRYAGAVASLRLVRSARMRAKREVHEAYLDQVTLDHEQGLEHGRIARARYREACASMSPAPASKRVRRQEPRPAESYRGAHQNAARKQRRALVLKEGRLGAGLTRRQADRMRDRIRRTVDSLDGQGANWRVSA
jgi:hypothetical protein